MFRPILILLFVGAALAVAAPISWAKEPPRERRAFARAMSKINVGMAEAEVLAILSRPDDVSTQKDWQRRVPDTLAVWRYGTAGHMKAATLGQICIGNDHRVQYFSGQGVPPPEGMFTEPELRRIIEALDELPGLDGWEYNPRPVIRAVNLLQPLGKERALAAIDEFLRVEFTGGHPREGVFVVLRTLFEVPTSPTVFPLGSKSTSGSMPPIVAGLAVPAKPGDEKLLPRFPVAIEGDIPFFLVEGYRLAGRAERPESHVAYFRKFGTLRAKPLSPTAKPVEALQAFEKSPRWYFKTEKDGGLDYDQRERILLGNQVMKLLETVHQIEPDSSGQFIGFESDEHDTNILLLASKLAIRWDAKESKYTFLDGKLFAPPDPNRYSLQFWAPEIAGLELEFKIKRESRRYVSLAFNQSVQAGNPKMPRGIVRVFNVNSPQKPLHEFQVSESFNLRTGSQSYSQSSVTTVDLEEGQKIRAVLTIGEKSYESPVYKP